jgi:RNase P subunit RPR2
MLKKPKLPVLTIFVPEYCSNCRTPYNEDNFKFTLVGSEHHCAWLCNSCFVRLHAEAMEKENALRLDVELTRR